MTYKEFRYYYQGRGGPYLTCSIYAVGVPNMTEAWDALRSRFVEGKMPEMEIRAIIGYSVRNNQDRFVKKIGREMALKNVKSYTFKLTDVMLDTDEAQSENTTLTLVFDDEEIDQAIYLRFNKGSKAGHLDLNPSSEVITKTYKQMGEDRLGRRKYARRK